MIDSDKQGEVSEIDALARADDNTWKSWFERILSAPGEPAPEAIIRRMLEVEPRPRTWLLTASRTVDRIEFDFIATSRRVITPFLTWFADGIVATFGDTSAQALEVRLERELKLAEGAAAAQRIVDGCREFGEKGVLWTEAVFLLALRLFEEGRPDVALEALQEAGPLSDESVISDAHVQRLGGSCLLALGRFDEALASLDKEMTSTITPLRGATRGPVTGDSKLDVSIGEAAAVALWAASTTPEWIRALGGLAQHAKGPKKRQLQERFDRGLDAMAETAEDPGLALGVVARQAKQRGLQETAKAAKELADKLRVELRDGIYFW